MPNNGQFAAGWLVVVQALLLLISFETAPESYDSNWEPLSDVIVVITPKRETLQ